MSSIYNTDPNISYADLLKVSTVDGTGVTASVKTITDAKGISSALGISTSQVNCANITFNGHSINTTDSGTILVPANITFSGTVTGAGSVPALTHNYVFVGNSSNAATAVALSGDATIADTGALTLATANASPGSTTISNITTNAKGLVTANTSASTTGSGNVVLSSGPTLSAPILGTVASGNISACTSTSMVMVTPILGTPTSGVLSNCTAYPVANIANLGTGIATFLATPTSANLATAVTNETGSGALVFANTPTLVTPILGVAQATSLQLGSGTVMSTYSAGSWSPSANSFTFSNGGSATWSAAAYVKIGRLVYCTATLTNSVGGASTITSTAGISNVSNIPYTTNGSAGTPVTVMDSGAGALLGTGNLNGIGVIYAPAWSTIVQVCFVFTYIANAD